MKKIIATTLILGVGIIGYSSLGATDKTPKLKASKEKVITSMTKKENGEVKYAYISDKKVDKKVKENGAKELVEKRTHNTQFFDDNTARVFSSSQFYKGDDWYEIEYATTTEEVFDKETKVSWLDVVFGKTAIADTVYSSTADGRVYNYDSGAGTWSTVRSATEGATGFTASGDSNNFAGAKAGIIASGYEIQRIFYYFDLSGLSGTVSSVDIKIYGTTNGQSNVSCQLGSQSDILVKEDFDAFSGSEYGHTSTWSTTGYNTISFNAQGVSDTSGQVGSGTLKICCREYEHDYLDSTPSQDYANGLYFADNTGTDKDPYLDITLAAPAITPNITNNGGTININGANLINN